MSVSIKNGKLVIELPLQKPTASKTGKSQIVATTKGFADTSAQVAGKPVRVAVNAII
jgi:hypothetical protein